MQAPQRLWAVAQDFAKPTRSELLIQVPETPFRSNSAAGNGSTGILNTGALTLASGSTFSVDLEGSVAGTGYDQVDVTGEVFITGSNLLINTALGLAVGDTLFILENDGIDPITGTSTARYAMPGFCSAAFQRPRPALLSSRLCSSSDGLACRATIHAPLCGVNIPSSVSQLPLPLPMPAPCVRPHLAPCARPPYAPRTSVLSGIGAASSTSRFSHARFSLAHLPLRSHRHDVLCC
jgi:hypothetical protein